MLDAYALRMADAFGGRAGGDWDCGERGADRGPLAVAATAVSAGHRNGAEPARHQRLHAVDLAHAGFELRLVRGAALARGPGRDRVAARADLFLRPARVSAALCCDVGSRPGHGRVSGGRAYCAGPLWALPFVEGARERHRVPRAPAGSSYDLRRPGLRVIVAVLPAAADRPGGGPHHFDVVRVHLRRCAQDLPGRRRLAKRLGGTWARIPFRAAV